MNPTMILATVLQLLVVYREARDKQRALKPTTGVPDDPNTQQREDFLTNAQLTALLAGESQNLQARAAELIAKYQGNPT